MSYKLPCGFRFAGLHCGIGARGKKDLALFYSTAPCVAAGVWTRNRIKAAPVLVSSKNIKNKVHAIIANSGCANACTGDRGMKDAQEMCSVTAGMLGVRPGNVLVASTGVIGKYLPMDNVRRGIRKITAGIKNVTGGMAGMHSPNVTVEPAGKRSPVDAVRAIMTTDTVEKVAGAEIRMKGKPVRIWGCVKGAGMIHPDMATLLCFIFTDAAVSGRVLAPALRKVVSKTFNCMSVDGDTSTNDTVFLLANGLAGNKTIDRPDGADFNRFYHSIENVCRELAKMVAADGEGATKFITIKVSSAGNYSDAKKVASAVATSPLVKTAMFGEDPNWGRIVACVGRSGVKINPGRLKISINGHEVAAGCSSGCTSNMKKELSRREIEIGISLGAGSAGVEYYTCDLSYGYIKINADYTT